MRISILLISALALIPSLPVQAAEWSTYANSRYGYVVGVPPGFTGQGESDSGDGQVFRSGKGTETLRVWGGFLTEKDFSAEIAWRQKQDASDGLKITYQASTPKWASYSGTKGGLIHYSRAIARCGDQYAMFELDYSKAEAARLDPVVGKLVGSLQAGRC
ncbi:MAG TPA: hypothetical protein VGM83_02160 [Devosiaceae bacterium]|jgi:hypothetical protein